MTFWIIAVSYKPIMPLYVAIITGLFPRELIWINSQWAIAEVNKLNFAFG